MSLFRRRRPSYSYTAASPREYHRSEWSGVLESSAQGVEWRAEWTVVWWSEGNRNGHPAPDSVAIVALRERAAALAREASFSDDVLRHRLAAELAQERSVADGRMWVSAQNVRLELAEHSAALVLRWREHVAEQAEITRLRDSVLVDLPTAMLWWLQRNNYNVKEAVALEPSLKKLVELVSANNAPEHWTQRLSTALAAAVPSLPEQSLWQVNHQIECLLKTYGGEEVADEFARHVA